MTVLAFGSVDTTVSFFSEAIHLYCFFMSGEVPTVLIFGHSFVKRLHRDLQSNFDSRADESFNLRGTVSVFFHGIGGRTVAKLRSFDLHVVERFAPDVIVLEVGTNDLVDFSPEVVGSQIESLVRLLIDSYSVRVVGVCHVIPRGASHAEATIFARRADILRQYLGVVLDSIPNVFCWLHKPFSHPTKNFYLADGVHVNPAGQYLLYRSYRGAILKALGML